MIDGLPFFFLMMMSDDINLTAGNDADTVAAGKGNQQSRNDARSNPRQNQRGGDTYFSGGGSDNNQQWVISQILDHGQQIRELSYRLDNIPNDFATLKIQFESAKDKIKKLEDLEVIVTPEKVTVRPTTPEVTLTSSTLVKILIFSLTLVIIIVAILVWLQVTRG